MGRNNSVRKGVGLTMSYGANAFEMSRRAPILVDKSYALSALVIQYCDVSPSWTLTPRPASLLPARIVGHPRLYPSTEGIGRPAKSVVNKPSRGRKEALEA